MFTVAQIDEHLVGMGHSGSLNKVRNKEAMYERAGAFFCLKHKTLEQIRTMALASTIHDDFFNYALPADYGSLIDLMPQDNQNSWDKAYRLGSGAFDLRKAFENKIISIEGSEGVKTIRIDWRSRQGKVLSAMNDTTGWAVVGTAANIALDTITRMTGGGSLRFDVAASGDGVKNVALSTQDFTNENGVADVFTWAYFPTVANLTSITLVWGNDVTTKYWTGVVQTTQADGSAFKAGWNLVRVPWSTAVQSGVVAPATIDSLQVTIQSTGVIANVRLDNVVFSIGRNFDMKYYSKYVYKDATTGTWISKINANSTADFVLIDNDTLPAFLMELGIAMAHQLEGTDSVFDLDFFEKQLKEISPIMKAQTPNMSQRLVGRSTSGPRLRRMGRMGRMW